MREAALNLQKRFGRQFRGDFGWAHDALLASDEAYAVAARGQERKRDEYGPTFADLERSLGMESARLEYRFASQGVHASPAAADAVFPAEEQGYLQTGRRPMGAHDGRRECCSFCLGPDSGTGAHIPPEQDAVFASVVQGIGTLADLATEAFNRAAPD